MNVRQIAFSALAALACGGAGYLIGKQTSEPQPAPQANQTQPARAANPPPKPAIPKGATGAVGVPPAVAEILGGGPLTDATALALTYRALEEADPVNRMAAISLLLASMTPSNATEMFKAFIEITSETGRTHDTEWHLMLKRFGEVAGATGLKMVTPPNEHNLSAFIEGMAAADSEGTPAALKAAGIDPRDYHTALLKGICRKDPEKALQLALSGDYQNIDGKSLVNQAILVSGLNGAREALEKAINAAPEEAGANPEFTKLFGSFAEALFFKHLISNTPGEMLPWLEKQKDQPYISDNLIDLSARESLNKGNAAETIAWVARMNEGQSGPVAGSNGLRDALNTNPAILNTLDDAAFAKLVPLLPKDRGALEYLAMKIRSSNSSRAEQLMNASRALAAQPNNPSGPVRDQ